jgi:DNA-directed RNA polymerase subunit RPC12/RpoP
MTFLNMAIDCDRLSREVAFERNEEIQCGYCDAIAVFDGDDNVDLEYFTEMVFACSDCGKNTEVPVKVLRVTLHLVADFAKAYKDAEMM